MAKTTAERQQDYRDRLKDDSSMDRINMVVSVQTTAQLARLARHLGISKKEVIERMTKELEITMMTGFIDQQATREYFAPFPD